MSWTILPADGADLDAAKTLVNRIFTHQGLLERLFFFAYKHRTNPIVLFLMKLVGIASLDTFWIAKSAEGEALGTIGLYAYRADAHEARWLSWYVVTPEDRGFGLGSALLRHAEKETLAQGFSYLRLYTGSGPLMAKAQEVYEHAGYRVTRTRTLPWETVIYREKKLKGEVS